MPIAVDRPKYNEAPVIRGEILLDLNLLYNREDERDQMNRDKKGGRYRYPHSLIEMQAFIRAYLRLPYRQLESLTHALLRWEPKLRVPDYTTTCRRVNTLDINLEPRLDPDERVTLAVDASGVKVADRGEWMHTKWRKWRGFLKVHIAVDVKTKQIMALEVIDERTGDGRMLEPLVEHAEMYCRVERVILDGAYDSRRSFSHLAGKGIDPGIRVRKSSSRRVRGCPVRKRVVEEYLQDPEEWKSRVGYGRRWMAETAFSVFKEIFGEHVVARKYPNMVRGMLLKVSLYNLLMSLNPVPGVSTV